MDSPIKKAFMISQRIFFALLTIAFITSCNKKENNVGETEIAKWQHGKRAAISLT
jgi:hypothetical protein